MARGKNLGSEKADTEPPDTIITEKKKSDGRKEREQVNHEPQPPHNARKKATKTAAQYSNGLTGLKDKQRVTGTQPPRPPSPGKRKKRNDVPIHPYTRNRSA